MPVLSPPTSLNLVASQHVAVSLKRRSNTSLVRHTYLCMHAVHARLTWLTNEAAPSRGIVTGPDAGQGRG